jgi:lactoylglutathione lyase
VSDRPRLVGINHVALEVGDVDAALEFYGRLFTLDDVERQGDAAFIELGDQFIALMQGRSQPPDTTRHFGLVVDDKDSTRRALEAAGVPILPGRFLEFLDPWGNRVQVVQYDQIRFAKTPEVLEEMGLEP